MAVGISKIKNQNCITFKEVKCTVHAGIGKPKFILYALAKCKNVREHIRR